MPTSTRSSAKRKDRVDDGDANADTRPAQYPRIEPGRQDATLIEIHEAGDVIFEANRKGHPHVQLKVLSSILSLASRPFASMLSGRYLEGRNLNTDDPPIIELPDDKWDGLRLMFETLHHKCESHYPHSRGSLGLSPVKLLRMVKVAEKYDCLRAVRDHMGQLLAATRDEDAYDLDTAMENMNTKRFLQKAVDRVAVSYIVQDRGQFAKNCQDIVDHSPVDESLVDALVGAEEHLVPGKIFHFLSEKRVERRDGLLDGLRFVRSSTRAIDQSRFAFSRVYKLLEESETEPDKIQQWKDNANPETYHCDMEEIFSAWKRLKLTSRQLAKALEMDVLLLLASKQADVMHGYAGAAEKSAVLTFFNNVVRQWLMSSPNYCCQCAKDETWPLGRLSLGFPHAQSCGNDCDW